MDALFLAIAVLFGAAAGGLTAAFSMRAQKQSFQAAADAAMRSSQAAFLEAARSTLETVRAEITGDLALRQSAIEGTVRPLADSVQRLDAQVREFDAVRRQAFGGIEAHLSSLAKETIALGNALRAPQSRGRWGELTLRRVVELAGMNAYCDFVEQESRDGQRPDMVVRLPGTRSLVVDAKAPLAAFLEMQGAPDDVSRRAALERHGQQISRHVDTLASRQYWAQFQPAPDLVILFLPGEQFFSAALEAKPALIEYALERKVLLSTPITLISVLKGIAYGWRQEALAENAEQIRRIGAEFQDRIAIFLGHYVEAGRQLKRAVEAYNQSVGSWESRLTPSIRRMRDLGAGSGAEPPVVEPIDVAPRMPAS
jgi:DNA recombination protein RmuC